MSKFMQVNEDIISMCECSYLAGGEDLISLGPICLQQRATNRGTQSGWGPSEFVCGRTSGPE